MCMSCEIQRIKGVVNNTITSEINFKIVEVIRREIRDQNDSRTINKLITDQIDASKEVNE